MIIVSSCLAGIPSRYDGRHCQDGRVAKLVKEGRAIPLCPEQLGGLPTPRACCEITKDQDGKRMVRSKDGREWTHHFIQGARKTLEVAKILEVKYLILKSKSPSCGYGRIYDGTFTGRLIEGNGITAQLLLDNGFTIYREDGLDHIPKEEINK